MDKKKPKKMGRPTTYTPELANLICERVATHTYGLKKLCRMYDDMPSQSTINLWRYKHTDFSEQYAQAKVFQIETLVDEILEISDDTSHDQLVNDYGNAVCNSEFIARSRLRVDTRKWLAAKLVPKVYGAQKNDNAANPSLIEQLIFDLKL